MINERVFNMSKLRIIYYFMLTEDRIIYYNDNDSMLKIKDNYEFIKSHLNGVGNVKQ